MKVYIVFVALILAFSCYSADICSKDVNKNDCKKYQQRGLNFSICQWRHIFPTMANMNLDNRNKIYLRSKKYCDNWRQSELNLIPDVEGNYCKDEDTKRAPLCARYKLARADWQINALKILLPVPNEFPQEYAYEMLRILQEEKEFKETNADLLKLDISFPTRESIVNWRSTLITNSFIGLFVILYLNYGLGQSS